MRRGKATVAPRGGRVRILYVIDALLLGGTEKQLVALIQGLDTRRFDARLCTLRPSTMDLAALGCPILELGVGSFAAPAAWRGLTRLRRYVRDERIDLIQTFFQDATILGGLATVGTGIRARVGSFRDLGFWRTPAKVWQLRRLYPIFDRFIANSVAVAEHAARADGIALERIDVIPNGVRIPARAAKLDSGSVVGLVANLNRPVKRVDLFIEAASLVRQAVPHARFVILGEGYLHDALAAQAARLGMADAVRFAGQVDDTSQEILSFDVGVLSSDSEGLSNAVLEYMAAGIPVVCRAGSNSDLVTDGKTGIVVAGDDPAALADPIVRLLTDGALRVRMGAAGRRLAHERYSLDACVRRHEALYSRLLATSARHDKRAESLVGADEEQA